MIGLEEQLAVAKRQRTQAQKKAAAANKENEALRQEARRLRQKNYTLQQYIDNPRWQVGYRRRYYELREAVAMAKDLLAVIGNGLEVEVPVTLEPPRVPEWARVQHKKD